LNDALQPLTRRLAELLADESGTHVLAQMQLLTLAASKQPVPRGDAGLRVGVWDPVPREGGAVEFARAPDAAAEWRYWADIERIPPKAGPRVVLIGESVARGYLFDPAVTPARLLEAALGVEVVDLARTDLVPAMLTSLVEALTGFEPDVVVLFAGNNWTQLVFEIEELTEIAGAFRAGGVDAARVVYQRLLGQRARETLAAVRRLVEAPLYVVVPQFNLGDWTDEPALAALASGAVTAEEARDAVVGAFVPHSPRCPAVVGDVLREGATIHSYTLIDLVAALGPSPGRELFLDYCHLTLEGMRCAVAGIAAAVARGLGVELRDGSVEVPARDEAVAHLLAAIHNAHYGQPSEIVRWHCRRAVTLHPPIAEQMRLLVDLLTREAEPWLCGSWDALAEVPAVRRYLGGPEMLRHGRLADFELSEILAEIADGVDLRRELLLAESGEGQVDLLDPRLAAATFGDRSGHTLGPQRSFLRATVPVSRFFLVRRAAGVAVARLTCRAPGDVEVRVDGVPATSVPGVAEWSTFELRLPVRAGLNVVELAWPPAPPSAAQDGRQAADRLERGIYPDALRVRGEVHAFTVDA
jgi:hypothetical protein